MGATIGHAVDESISYRKEILDRDMDLEKRGPEVNHPLAEGLWRVVTEGASGVVGNLAMSD